jgi:mannose-1-phosphate guanylyltransferase
MGESRLMPLHAVILAGGIGERFWPLSRRDRPKQFLALFGARTLLQQTSDRLEGWIPADRRWIVAPGTLMPEIRRQLPELREDRCIVESVARNTAAAIGAAAALIAALDPGAFVLVLPADHWIPDIEPFRRAAERTLAAAEETGGLHLFGIPVGYPETGYGYIEQGTPLAGHDGVHAVSRFHEKPDRERALAYAKRTDMLWNAGIFLWKAGTILDAIGQWMPAMRGGIDGLRAALREDGGRLGPKATPALDRYFRGAPSESIDSAVLEKHGAVFVTRAGFRWSDVGSWLSWADHRETDTNGNRGEGRLLLHDTSDCVLYSSGDGVLAALGVRNLIVVRVKDVTLVCARDRAQEVRDLVRDARDRDDLKELF